MKTTIAILTLLSLLFLPVKSAHAVGTASGTGIVDSAILTYGIGATTGLTLTATTIPVVDNKVNVSVTKNTDATVTPSSTNDILAFVIKNNGNTTQRYALSAVNSAGIVMNNVRIYRDNGTTLDAWDASDTLYADAGTFGDVAPDGTLNILLVSDTPGGATDGQTSDYNLIATTVDASSTTVTQQTSGVDTAGVDVVFADIAGSADAVRDGIYSAVGRYTISSATLNVAKTVLVYSDPSNGTTNPKAIAGATLRYTILVNVIGSATALNVVITDPIPANTTYAAGTLKWNDGITTKNLTDGNDADEGEVSGTPMTVTVRLGNLSLSSPQQTIKFDATINPSP